MFYAKWDVYLMVFVCHIIYFCCQKSKYSKFLYIFFMVFNMCAFSVYHGTTAWVYSQISYGSTKIVLYLKIEKGRFFGCVSANSTYHFSGRVNFVTSIPLCGWNCVYASMGPNLMKRTKISMLLSS